MKHQVVQLREQKDFLRLVQWKPEMSEEEVANADKEFKEKLKEHYNISLEEYKNLSEDKRFEIIKDLSEDKDKQVHTVTNTARALIKHQWLESFLRNIDEMGVEEAVDRYEEHVEIITFALDSSKFSGALLLPEIYSPYTNIGEDKVKEIKRLRKIFKSKINNLKPKVWTEEEPIVLDKEIEKLAWMHELGLLENLLDRFEENDKKRSFNKVGQVIEKFTGINHSTIKNALRAIYGTGDMSLHPTNNPENKIIMAELRKSFKLKEKLFPRPTK